LGDQVIYHCDRHWLDLVWGRVSFGVASELLAETKLVFAGCCQPRVWGPHAGESLPHCTQGSFHCARLDRLLTGCEVSGTIPLPKDLEEQDRIPHIREPGVDAEVRTEGGPDEPSFFVCVGSSRNDAGSARFLRKAEVTEESISLVGCTKRQEFI
jgi:hypothetical protein